MDTRVRAWFRPIKVICGRSVDLIFNANTKILPEEHRPKLRYQLTFTWKYGPRDSFFEKRSWSLRSRTRVWQFIGIGSCGKLA